MTRAGLTANETAFHVWRETMKTFSQSSFTWRKRDVACDTVLTCCLQGPRSRLQHRGWGWGDSERQKGGSDRETERMWQLKVVLSTVKKLLKHTHKAGTYRKRMSEWVETEISMIDNGGLVFIKVLFVCLFGFGFFMDLPKAVQVAKLNRRYRDFPYTFYPCKCIASCIIIIFTSQSGMLVMTN